MKVSKEQLRKYNKYQRWLFWVGLLLLVGSGLAITALVLTAWQPSHSLTWHVRNVLQLVALYSLGFWALVTFLLVLLYLWSRHLELFWQYLERTWLETVLDEIGHRVAETTEHHLRRVTDSLALVRESVYELQAQETHHIGWQETLHHVFLLLNETDDEGQLYNNIVTAFAMVEPFATVMLFRGEHELGPISLVATVGLPQEVIEEWRGKPWRPPLWGVVAPALAKRRIFALNIQEEGSEHSGNEFPWPLESAYVVALPLLGISTLQGVVVLAYKSPIVQSPSRLRLLELVAWFSGRTLESLHLARSMQEHLAELVTIQSLTRTLITAQSLDDIVRLLQQEIVGITGKADIALVLQEDFPQEAFRTAHPADTPGYRRLAEAIDWRVLRWSYNAAQPVFYTPGQISDDVGDLLFEATGQVMVVPLEGRHETLGVMVVVNQEPNHLFEEQHLIGVRTVAGALVMGLYTLRYDALRREHPSSLTLTASQ